MRNIARLASLLFLIEFTMPSVSNAGEPSARPPEMTDDVCWREAEREGALTEGDARTGLQRAVYDSCTARRGQQTERTANTGISAAVEVVREPAEDVCRRRAEAEAQQVAEAFRADHRTSAYASCLANSERSARDAERRRERAAVEAESSKPLNISTLTTMMDAGRWDDALKFVEDHGVVYGPGRSTWERRLDNDVTVPRSGLATCIERVRDYFVGRSHCLSVAKAAEKETCLRAVQLRSSTQVAAEYTKEACGFVYERFEQSAREDRETIASLAREAADGAAKAMQRWELQKAAEKKARADPAYRRAEIAATMCTTNRLLAQVQAEEQRVARLDEASGTVDLAKKRQLTSARLHHEDALVRLRKEYGATSADVPADPCGQQPPEEFVREYVRAQMP